MLMVYPSGSARATRPTPVTPPAPPMFSTRIGWPSEPRITSVMVRTMVSTAPPAASGMTTVMGFDAKPCAWATAADASTAQTATNARLMPALARRAASLLSLQVGGLDDRPPFLGFRLLVRAQRLRRLLLARRLVDAGFAEALRHRRVRERVQQHGVEPRDDLLGRALGRPGAIPQRRGEAGEPGF